MLLSIDVPVESLDICKELDEHARTVVWGREDQGNASGTS